MTGSSDDREHERYDELAAGYALSALEPDEEQQFTEHLAQCSRCAATLADFSDIAADLATVSAVEAPPAQVWSGIRDAIGAAPRDLEVMVDEPADYPVVVLDQRRTVRRSTRWLAAAAAVAAIAGGVGIWALTSNGSSGKTAPLALCRADSSCHVVGLHSRSGRADEAYLLVRDRAVEIVATGLPAIDTAARSYVLWQMPNNGRPIGIVAFDPHAGPDGVAARGVLRQPLGQTTAFAVSREAGRMIPAAPSPPTIAFGVAT
jgi:anti-sigma-K factor RskA